ncbi:MAG TPA: hypothetical protein PKC18_06900, partial [Lacipirellulaceae bacterium]|nr:hypothetical protein [Lacipirellulaceae bacterium]
WGEIVVPTAKGLETFFWRVAWFAVLVAVLCSYNPFRQGDRHEDRTSSPVERHALRQESAAQR